MEKKSLFIFITFLLILNFSVNIIKAELPSTNVPFLGDVNSETGLPTTFEKYQNAADNLSNEETRVKYLKQEWTRIFAKNKFIAPILYYTNDFFSMLNPVWLAVFQIPFSWSWQFIFALIIWIMLIIILYAPSNALTNFGFFLTLIFSITLASLIGSTGTIKKAVDVLTIAITNIWLAILCLVISIVLVTLYKHFLGDFGKNLKKETKELEVKKAQETIIAHGNVSEKALKKEFGNGGGI